MRARNLKKTLTIFLIVSLFSQTALVFSPQTALAQYDSTALYGSSGGAGGSVQTGFDVQGIAGSALACSGVMDKFAGLLGNLFGAAVPTTVPINNAADDLRETCLKQITRMVINRILDKITLSTVDWINSGFDADAPLWLEDPDQFFGDIATSEINAVTGWFTCNGATDCENYPFGRLVMTSILTNLQNQTQQNLQFSLNQVLAHGTYEEFRYNFSVGGWAGYTAFLEPQNNPFGNYLLVNESIGRRISGTNVNIAGKFNAQLSQSGGFLSPRVCAQSGLPGSAYIPESGPGSDMHLGEFYQVLPAGSILGDVTLATLPPAVQAYLSGFTNPAEQANEYNFIVLRSRCKQWRTTTPGQVVGTRLTQGLDNATNQLIAADDVAENIGLIFDALLNQLVTAGLKELSSDNQNSVLLAQVNGQQPGAVANGQTPPTGGDTILGNGPAGIADTDILEVQNQYITQTQIVLPILDELMKKIRALDYCVPGPNPRWIDSATTNFQGAIATIPPANGLPTEENQFYYRAAIQSLTGATITENLAMYNHTQFTDFIQEVFDRYVAKMTQSYSPNLAPPTTRLFLPALFNDMEVYNAELADLNEYLANINSLLPTVEIIQTTLADLAAANGGVLDPADPEVQAQVSIFNSISNHLATQTQLNTLIARQDVYEAQILVVDGHVTSCLNETVFSGTYQSANNRMSYPSPIFPYPGLPGPDLTFLPGVVFGDETEDIDIQINGVSVQVESDDLTDFEGILQSIY